MFLFSYVLLFVSCSIGIFVGCYLANCGQSSRSFYVSRCICTIWEMGNYVLWLWSMGIFVDICVRGWEYHRDFQIVIRFVRALASCVFSGIGNQWRCLNCVVVSSKLSSVSPPCVDWVFPCVSFLQ